MVFGEIFAPLNEVELVADSLRNNNGVLRGSTVIRYAPEKSVLGLAIGDRISLGVLGRDRKPVRLGIRRPVVVRAAG